MKNFKKKSQYSRISSNKKKVLIDLVMNKKLKLCKASQLVGIKYSSAKTIMRLFRNKNNLFRKDNDHEKNLKIILQNTLKHCRNKKEKLFTITREIDKNEQIENTNKYNISITNSICKLF
jgi:hypothetical protein